MANKILFLILTACFLAPTSVIAHGGEHDELIIRMTENGFEPKELTVTEGDEVLFINNDDTDRWPASNFHPTHGIYPEFDPLKGIAPSNSWKFTFDKVGTWRMHDHLIPHMTGAIVVLENPDEEKGRTLDTNSQGPTLWGKIKTFFVKLFRRNKASTAEFKSLSEQGKYARLEEISAEHGPKEAWELVLDTYNTPEGVMGKPHDMAHLVGQLIFKKYGFEGLSICTPVFAFGCYHGLMEVAFNKDDQENYQKNLLLAEKGCENAGEKNSPSYFSCIHGIGHGIVTFREHDLDLALTDCDILPQGLRTYCYDGVFMELSISAPPSFYKKSDPIYPCNAVDDSHQAACARSQTQVMRSRHGLDTRVIAEACINTRNSAIIYHCTDSLGYFIAHDAEVKAEKIIYECRKIPSESLSAQCMAAAAGELVFQNVSNWQKLTKEVCRSLVGNYRTLCEERVESVKTAYGRN